MKLVMTLVARNEGDIVESNLVYHLNKGVDHVLAIDDDSTDATPEILESFRRHGYLSLFPKPPGSFKRGVRTSAQAEWCTALARSAVSEHGADWVLPGDADELWWPLWGDLKHALEQVPKEYGAAVAPRSEFVSTDPPQTDAIRDFRVREARSGVLPKVAHRGYEDIVLSSGNHRAARDARAGSLGKLESGNALRLAPVSPLRIFHYPIRTDDQLRKNVERRGSERALIRDPLFRVASDEAQARAATVGLEDPWRRQALADGLQAGTLVSDGRLSSYLGAVGDPRRERPSPGVARDQPLLSDELVEVQGLVMDALQLEERRLRRRLRRRELDARRPSRSAGPLAGLMDRLGGRSPRS